MRLNWWPQWDSNPRPGLERAKTAGLFHVVGRGQLASRWQKTPFRGTPPLVIPSWHVAHAIARRRARRGRPWWWPFIEWLWGPV